MMSNSFSLSEVKAIMHSKRANLYYLEKCHVMQKEQALRAGSPN